MPAYFNFVLDGCIVGQAVSSAGAGNVTQARYEAVMGAIHARPEGNYRLRAEDLTWEEYEPAPAPAPSDDDEIDAYEAMAIITGGTL